MTGPIGRLFGTHTIEDGVRGDALVLQSVAQGARHSSGGDETQEGTFRRFRDEVPLLLRVPGQAPYRAVVKQWLTRAKYPIAGTTVPVTVDRADPAHLRIEWDEVPEIDEWIAAGHPVFTDPDTVEAQLDQALGRPTTRKPPPTDSPTARVLARASSGASISLHGELLLSVLVPGRPRYGVRWRGRVPQMRLTPQWTDVPVRVDPGKPDHVDVLWEQTENVFDTVASRLQAATQRMAAAPSLLSGDPLDQIKYLAQLRDTGAMSESDFAEQKARLLSQM